MKKLFLLTICFAALLIMAVPALAIEDDDEDENAASMPAGHPDMMGYSIPEGYAGPVFAYPTTFIVCIDWAAQRKWYEDTFGLSLMQDYGPEQGVAIYLSHGNAALVLGDAKIIQVPLSGQRMSAYYLQFIVEDPQEAYDWAVSHGATGFMPPMDTGAVTVSAIQDPEGNEIWLVTPEEFGGMDGEDDDDCMCGDKCAQMCGDHCACPEIEDDDEDDDADDDEVGGEDDEGEEGEED